MEAAYGRAVEAQKGQRVWLGDFADRYRPDVIAADIAHLRRAQADFDRKSTAAQERESHKLAVVLETALHEQVNSGNWFGPDVKAYYPSDFDDVVNHVDSILHVRPRQGGSAYLALGLDVTYSPDITKKFFDVRQGIERGELSHVKYFRSPDMRGELKLVPRLIVGAGGDASERVARAWFAKNPALKDDPYRFMLAAEIRLQLPVYQVYAQRRGLDAVARKFEDTARMLDLAGVPKPTSAQLAEFRRDPVFKAIVAELAQFGQEKRSY